MKTDVDVDARGLNCPLPILRARKALNSMQSGQTLRVIATDPGSVQDFKLFAQHAIFGDTQINVSIAFFKFVG